MSVNKGKSEELFYRVWLKGSFQGDVIALRRVWSIPKNGASDEGEWYETLSHQKSSEFRSSIFRLAKKYKLPASLFLVLETYVIEGRILEGFLLHSSASCGLEWLPGAAMPNGLTPVEAMWKESGRVYTKIYISDIASLSDVRKYLEKNWHTIQALLERQGKVKKTKFKFSNNKSRDVEIYNLSQRTRNELEAIDEFKSSQKRYKDLIVASIITKKYGQKMTPENVRRIISRQKKMRAT